MPPVMANAARFRRRRAVNGVLVQPMVPQGVELVIGARNDPLFGPADRRAGLGGVLVEVLQGGALSPAPVPRPRSARHAAAAERRQVAARLPRHGGGRHQQIG